MDMQLKKKFLERWKEYFDEANLPITFYYSNEAGNLEVVKPPSGHQCFIGVLSRVRQGASLCFNVDSVGCGGGKRYLGFTEEIMPDFEYFLSCGIPGKLEGERYKKTPELVREAMKKFPVFKAPAQFIIFKRWDGLEQVDHPEVVILHRLMSFRAFLLLLISMRRSLTEFSRLFPQAVVPLFNILILKKIPLAPEVFSGCLMSRPGLLFPRRPSLLHCR